MTGSTYASYFWYNNEVVCIPRYGVAREMANLESPLVKYLHHDCVCLLKNSDGSSLWYGHFVINDGGTVNWMQNEETVVWVHKPLETLAIEFRTHLLLLGVL